MSELTNMSYAELLDSLRRDLLLDATTDLLPGTVRTAYGALNVVNRTANFGSSVAAQTFTLVDTFTFTVNNPQGARIAYSVTLSCSTGVASSKVRAVIDADGTGGVAKNITPFFFFNSTGVHTTLPYAGLVGGGPGITAQPYAYGNHTVNVYLQASAGSFNFDTNDFESLLMWELPS